MLATMLSPVLVHKFVLGRQLIELGNLRAWHAEPNSGLGKAISYLLNHWLRLFLQQP
jgi:hypothetical protein